MRINKNMKNFSLNSNNLIPLDMTYLESRFFGDSKLLSEVLIHFKKNCRISLKEMKSCLSNGQITGLINETHKLRGSLVNIMQNSLTTRLKEIEIEAGKKYNINLTIEEINYFENELFKIITYLKTVANKWKK